MHATSKKTIFLVFLVFVLVFSMGTASFAVDGGDTYQVYNTYTDFERVSNTKATALISSDTFSIATYIKVTVTLLEYSNGDWIMATGVPTAVQRKTVYNTSAMYFPHNWVIKPYTSYQLKVVVEDKTANGSIFTDTSFSNSI